MYKSVITESSAELSKIEAVAMMNLTDCEGIDVAVNESLDGYVIIHPVKWVKLHVTNDRAKENKEYDVLVLVDADGTKYKTGSSSFMNAFFDIYEPLEDETGWGLKIFGRDSNNYKGKKFLTCSVVLEA